MRNPETILHAISLFLLAVAISFSAASAQEPLSAAADAYIQTKFDEDRLAYELRVVKEYDEQTTDPPEVRKAARELIETSRRFWSHLAPKEVTTESLHKQSQQVLSAGSNDPVVLLVALSHRAA